MDLSHPLTWRNWWYGKQQWIKQQMIQGSKQGLQYSGIPHHVASSELPQRNNAAMHRWTPHNISLWELTKRSNGDTQTTDHSTPDLGQAQTTCGGVKPVCGIPTPPPVLWSVAKQKTIEHTIKIKPKVFQFMGLTNTEHKNKEKSQECSQLLKAS